MTLNDPRYDGPQIADEEQQRLLDETVRMGELAATQLEAALGLLGSDDPAAAQRIIAGDAAIDALEQQISHDVMRLALHGPMARDLRGILAAIRITSDIERIGDFAANIAKRSTVMGTPPPLLRITALHAIGTLAVDQLRQVLAAYRDHDAASALRVRERDVAIDTAYTRVFGDLLEDMRTDPYAVPACTHLLFIAKNLERIGDHATNIAENVWFLVHGDDPLPPREKRDHSSTLGAGSAGNPAG
ncbi:phosphate signaling complex protein PhoU [Lysobacter sp. A03]|uniref:phosphate signaling complex protein PhoU n=1 Tax=Lysobacter sp. A03 TaxID=1199154 RepID=UPI0005B7356C|nr:phosphate signaling complex protein PhoU [Lysobacter sp. A03]KIQ98140.1 Phosphate transport system regulatory protein PhoU [Lysobacter sp. A03]